MLDAPGQPPDERPGGAGDGDGVAALDRQLDESEHHHLGAGDLSRRVDHHDPPSGHGPSLAGPSSCTGSWSPAARNPYKNTAVTLHRMVDDPIALADRRVVVTGGAGFLGRRVVAELRTRGAEPYVARSAEYDLTQRAAADQLMADHRPSLVIHLAALVGGIGYNQASRRRCTSPTC